MNPMKTRKAPAVVAAIYVLVAACCIGILMEWLFGNQNFIVSGLIFGFLFSAVIFVLSLLENRFGLRTKAAVVLAAGVALAIFGGWRLGQDDRATGWLLLATGAVIAIGHLVDLVVTSEDTADGR